MSRIRPQHMIALSLSLHALLFAALLLKREAHAPVEKTETLFVELEQRAEPALARYNNNSNKIKPSTGAPGKRPSGFSLSDLAPFHKPHLVNAPHQGEFRPEMDSLSPYAASAEPFAQETAQSFGAYAWAHRQLQQGLGYPEPFRRHGIAGQAEARFAFAEDGGIEMGSIKVKADSPYLRVYVHRLIERTFASGPVPLKLRKWKNSLELFCFVQFSLVESETAVSLHMPTDIMGNRLYFARRSADGKNQLDKLKWKAGPLHGFLPVPSVGLDVMWFARQAQDLGKQKTTVDELAPFREDPLFYN